jgi:hypothetical protein
VINANIFPILYESLRANELEVRKEAVWAISNTATMGSREQIRYMVESGVIPPLCEVLTTYDAKIVAVGLEALQSILSLGEVLREESGAERNVWADLVTQCGGLDYIERCLNHSNTEVYHNALQLLESFFELSNTAEGDMPALNATGSAFEFGANNSEYGNYNF